MGIRRGILVAVALFGVQSTSSAGNYDVGASDTEIKIGQTQPYSGPASAYSNQGKLETAFFKMINDKGGINGRKIKLISLDDGYSPPKTVEQTRRLVESEEVLLIFGALGTPTQSAVQRYLNQKGIPQLFVASGASKWNDAKHFPWTMGFQPDYKTEARAYARYLQSARRSAKIGVLYQNDDLGRDFLAGFKEGLAGNSAYSIVAEEAYDTTEPVIDSHIINLKASGADVILDASTPKFAAQAIRKIAALDWKPMHFVGTPSSSVSAVLAVGGLDASEGVISSMYIKDPANPKFASYPDFAEWLSFMKAYYPEGDLSEYGNGYAYAISWTMAHILQECGDNLTRSNIMKRAASMKDLEAPMLMPGIKLNTSESNFGPISKTQLVRFDGKQWVPLGELVEGK